MRVVMLSPEVYPYAKTGGLADVLAALPPALAAAGVEVTVCVPGYRSALRAAGTPAPGTRLHAPIASRMEAAEMVRIHGAPGPTGQLCIGPSYRPHRSACGRQNDTQLQHQ